MSHNRSPFDAQPIEVCLIVIVRNTVPLAVVEFLVCRNQQLTMTVNAPAVISVVRV